MTYEMRVEGVVARQVLTDVPLNPLDPPTSLDQFRGIRIQAEEETWFHSIGPGLEVEADAARVGPLMLSLYLFGNFYALVGDREVRLKGVNPDPAVPAATPETAQWDYGLDPFGLRLRAGLRFRWSPE